MLKIPTIEEIKNREIRKNVEDEQVFAKMSRYGVSEGYQKDIFDLQDKMFIKFLDEASSNKEDVNEIGAIDIIDVYEIKENAKIVQLSIVQEKSSLFKRDILDVCSNLTLIEDFYCKKINITGPYKVYLNGFRIFVKEQPDLIYGKDNVGLYVCSKSNFETEGNLPKVMKKNNNEEFRNDLSLDYIISKDINNAYRKKHDRDLLKISEKYIDNEILNVDADLCLIDHISCKDINFTGNYKIYLNGFNIYFAAKNILDFKCEEDDIGKYICPKNKFITTELPKPALPSYDEDWKQDLGINCSTKSKINAELINSNLNLNLNADKINKLGLMLDDIISKEKLYSKEYLGVPLAKNENFDNSTKKLHEGLKVLTNYGTFLKFLQIEKDNELEKIKEEKNNKCYGPMFGHLSSKDPNKNGDVFPSFTKKELSGFTKIKNDNENLIKEIEYGSNCQKCNSYNEYIEKSSNYVCYNCR